MIYGRFTVIVDGIIEIIMVKHHYYYNFVILMVKVVHIFLMHDLGMMWDVNGYRYFHSPIMDDLRGSLWDNVGDEDVIHHRSWCMGEFSR